MKSKKAIASMLAFTMVLTSVATFSFDNKNESSNAKAAFNDEPASNDLDTNLANAVSTISKSGEAELGTVDNPFTVLEVVPYKGMGLLGYMVPGQEPIELSTLGHTEKVSQLEFALGSSNGTSMLSYYDELKQASSIEESEASEWKEPSGDYKEDGYFMKTKVGEGKYVMTLSKDDVMYIPNNNEETFVNNLQTPKASSVETTYTANASIGFKELTEDESKLAYFRDVTFAQKGTSSYTVRENLIGNKQITFEYIEEGSSYSGVTYDAYQIQAYTDFYEKLNNAADESSYYCYEPSYVYDEEKDCFVYDPTGKVRYYIFFCVNTEGNGKYKASQIFDLSLDSYEGKVNVPDCYQVIEFNKYKDLMNMTDNYKVGNTYSKDMLFDDEDKLTSIATGDFQVTFISSSAKGAKKYEAISNVDITDYYCNLLFEQLSEGKYNSDVNYYPMYAYRNKTYIPVAFEERTEIIAKLQQEIASEFGLSDISEFKSSVEKNSTNREKLKKAIATYKYVIFSEITDEDDLDSATKTYIVSESRQVETVSHENPVDSMCMYNSNLSVTKSNKDGLCKAEVVSATFKYDDVYGNYNWNKETIPAGTKTDYLAKQVWIKGQPMSFYTQGGYVNNNWFVNRIIGIKDEKKAQNYQVKVVTVTPDELKDNPSYITMADIIYMSDNYDDGSALERMYLWEQYGRDKTGSKDLTELDSSGNVVLKSDSSKKSDMNFYSKDLDWNTTYTLFSRAAGLANNFVPIVMDSTIYTETLKGSEGRYSYYWNDKIKNVKPAFNPYSSGSEFSAGNSNIYKLYIMLYTKTSPLIFYNEYLKVVEDVEHPAPYDITVTYREYYYGLRNGSGEIIGCKVPDELYCYYWGDTISGNWIKMDKTGSWEDKNIAFKCSITDEMYSGATGSLKYLVAEDTSYKNQSVDKMCNQGKGAYDFLVEWPLLSYGKYDGNVTFTPKTSTFVSGTEDKIVNGEYNNSSLSSDAKKYWNELTFLPINNAADNTQTALKEKYVNDYLIPIITSKDEDKRASDWPGINTQKNVFSFDASVKKNISSDLSEALVGGTDASKHLKEPIDYLEGIDYYSGGLEASSPSWIDIMYYLIHAQWERLFDVEINNKTKLHILEIEPCLDFTMDADMFRQWLPEYTGDIEVTSWISTEYIGKINNVNEDFDVIYIGTNNKLLNTDFLDDNLDGKYYVHLGDLATSGRCINHNYGGKNAFWLNYDVATEKNGINYHYKVSNYENSSDYDENGAVWYRYSGNDITKVKYDELMNYVKSDYAVVLADELYDKKVSRFDTSSYVYQFAKNTVGLFDNVFKLSNLKNANSSTKATFQKYAGQTKLALDISSSDAYIISSTAGDLSNSECVVSTKELQYNYSIRDKDAKETDRYNVTLYADVNGDGTYSEDEIIAYDENRKASNFASGNYTIKRKLQDDFIGVLHWALVVEKQDALKHTATVEGYLLIKNDKAEKQVIRVLQISSSKRDKNGLWMEHTSASDTSGTMSSFYENPLVSNYYSIRCVRVTTTEFANFYNSSKKNMTFKYFDKEGNLKSKKITAGQKFNKDDPSTDLLKDFDMVVYGFADSVADISNANGAYDNLMAFVEEGKAFLASHDTTSMYNFSGRPGFKYNDDQTSWASGNLGNAGVQDDYYMTGLTSTQYIRDKAGMNRFGVPTLYSMSNGIDVDATPHDTAFIADTDQTKSYNRYFSYDGNNNPSLGSPVNIGYTDYLIEMGRYIRLGIDSYGKNQESKLMYKTTIGFTTDNPCNLATKVNEGQITKFPYSIPDKIDTSYTHGQYYQLNLDDPNIVVWYCLGGLKGKTGTYYDISRNDARNLYYLYSYNNVFYTGVGHDTTNTTDDEKRLFVNTMIAAFRATFKEPTINIPNRESYDTETNTSMMYYYEQYDPDSANSGTDHYTDSDQLDIYFNVDDFNLISDIMSLKIYTLNDDGTINSNITSASASKVKLVKEVDGSLSSVTIDDKDGLKIRGSYEYIFKFPMTYMNNSATGMYKLKFVVENVKGKKSEMNITIGKRTLFMLD